MKLIKMFSVAAVLSLLLSGCSNQGIKKYSGIQTGDYFVLKQPLTVSPDSARVFIQNGHILGSGGFNHWRQHCRVEINTLSEQTQTIPALSYRITKIQVDEEPIAGLNRPVQLAFYSGFGIYTDFSRIGGFVSLGSDGSEFGRVETMDLVHFYLQHPQAADILRLTCAGALSDGNPMDAPDSYRPDLAEINAILGPVGYIASQR